MSEQGVPRMVPWFEVARRLGLVAGLAAGVWLFCATYHGPFLRAKAADVEEQVAALRDSSTGGELKRWLAGERVNELFPDVDRVPEREWRIWRMLPDKVVSVRGPEWEAFLRAAPGRCFRPSDPPIGAALAELPYGSYALRLEGPRDSWLEVYSSQGEEASLGGGRYDPASFFHPSRPIAAWPALAGLIVYILLPWPRRHPNVVAMSGPRLVLMDIVGTGLFMFFFALPFLIVGSSTAAVTEWAGFTAIFWAFSLLAGGIIWWAVRYAAYRIVVLDDRLSIESVGVREEFVFADVASVRAAVLRPPRWLVVLSFVGAFVGKHPHRQAGQVGRALILASSAAGGCRIEARDGRSAYIWATDSVGNVAFRNFDRLKAALEGLPASKEPPLEVRSFFPPAR